MLSNMYGYIYMTTNTVNGVKYIGKHKSESFDSKYLGSGILLKRAIDKYGSNNFVVEMLESANSLQELNSLEVEYIKKFDCVNDLKDYLKEDMSGALVKQLIKTGEPYSTNRSNKKHLNGIIVKYINN